MFISFDLETLSSEAIVQIGAVRFDYDKVHTDKYFNTTISFNSLERYNFELSYSNISFWLSQPKEAIDSVFFKDKTYVDIRLALRQFQDWVGKSSEVVLWSHKYDVNVLRTAYQKTGLGKLPFLSRSMMDITTLKGILYLKKLEPVKLERKGIHHDALDDAIYQAEYIRQNLNLLIK